MPVLASAVPVASPCLLVKRVDEQQALERVSGNDEPLHALEVAPRLVLIVGGAPRRQLLQITVPAAARMAGNASGVALARAGEDWLDAGPEDLEVQSRRRCGSRR